MQPCENLLMISFQEYPQQLIHQREMGQEKIFTSKPYFLLVLPGKGICTGDISIQIQSNSQNICANHLTLTIRVKPAPTPHRHHTAPCCPVRGDQPRHKRITSCRRVASQKLHIDPEELQELVWEIPIQDIANLYGVSTKAIEKQCRELGIPKPPRGYGCILDSNPYFPQGYRL